jgi:predicted ribosome quality control (RQC) complex YloA/Tae2 family protein
MDGILLYALVSELQSLIGAKINKIYQPNEHDILFQLRHQSRNLKLMISSHPVYARVHLTERLVSNPVEPPMFCMLLRKYLENGIIEAIEQVSLERVLTITIRHFDELGDVRRKQLLVEIMGRHSNIILFDPDRNVILDGIHHVTPNVSAHRVVMPGSSYIQPPTQDKLNFLQTSVGEWHTHLEDMPLHTGNVHDYLMGFSPLLSQLLSGVTHLKQLTDQLSNWKQLLLNRSWQPELVAKERLYLHIFPWPDDYQVLRKYEFLSSALDDYYGERALQDLLRQRTADLHRFISNERAKHQAKTVKLQRSLKDSEQADDLRIKGELLTASLHMVKRGEKQARVINYYDEAQTEMVIELDPLLSPAENAQRYFRKYNKLKASVQFIQEQLSQCQIEIDYLNTIQQQLDHAELSVIDEIREELAEQGYIRNRQKTRKKQKKEQKTVVSSYQSSEGISISVGRNNKQNDYLTMKLARNSDTWLHTKDIPGSHVVIHATTFGETTLKEAASLAAYYSQARASSQVPVDYTLVRHVHKPNGAKPGYVIYEQQKTVYVTPDEAWIQSILER